MQEFGNCLALLVYDVHPAGNKLACQAIDPDMLLAPDLGFALTASCRLQDHK